MPLSRATSSTRPPPTRCHGSTGRVGRNDVDKPWCAGEDLNLQSFRNQILSLARLPFRHARAGQKVAGKKAKLKLERFLTGPECAASVCRAKRVCRNGGRGNIRRANDRFWAEFARAKLPSRPGAIRRRRPCIGARPT